MKLLILVADGMIVDVFTDSEDEIEVVIADFDIPSQLLESDVVPLIKFEDSSHIAALEGCEVFLDADMVNAAFVAMYGDENEDSELPS